MEGRPPSGLAGRPGSNFPCPRQPWGCPASKPPGREDLFPRGMAGLLTEVWGRCGRKTPSHRDLQALPACCSFGIQVIRDVPASVYFHMTFFKKNSLPQMLDPESGMWRGKQLCPLPRPCTAPSLGAGSWGILGAAGRTWSACGTSSGLCSLPACAQWGPSRDGLLWLPAGPTTPGLESRSCAPVWHTPHPGQP